MLYRSGPEAGYATLYEGPPDSRGTSTMIAKNAVFGPLSKSSLVEVRTLDAIVKSLPWPVDFIKIDVEGMELQVISATDWSEVDIDVVLVEATQPNSTIPSHGDWDAILTSAGFCYKLFDGLNRFYSRTEHFASVEGNMVELWYPATVQEIGRAHV